MLVSLNQKALITSYSKVENEIYKVFNFRNIIIFNADEVHVK